MIVKERMWARGERNRERGEDVKDRFRCSGHGRQGRSRGCSGIMES
jgi:hypothetical protein